MEAFVSDVNIPPPMHCAWVNVGWEYFDMSECTGADVSLNLLDEAVCTAPTGSGGGGANGGLGLVSFTQDVGNGPGSCSFGALTELIAWDECTENFDHGDPHLHDPGVDCHTLVAESTNSLWAAISAEDHSCPSASF